MSSTKSQNYNHPFWPSPRAVRIARLMKIPGRLTHDKALKVLADKLCLSVHEFLHVKPMEALIRLGLAYNEDQALKMVGNLTTYEWWLIGGRRSLPCCL